MSENRVVVSLADAKEIDGASRLLRLASLGEELGTPYIADDGRALSARVSEGRFYLACIGQFKRGKSTLINALIGEHVLPVGFIPVTAVPTVIRFGVHPRARVQARDGSWQEIAVSELNQYVSEEHNPENAKGVTGVEVFVPSSLLSTGMCLVDTPGLGSVFTGNSAATQAFVPHIDAALVVVGADPPLAGEELALVEAVGRQVQNLILVLNKADQPPTRKEKRLWEEVLPTLYEMVTDGVIEVQDTNVVKIARREKKAEPGLPHEKKTGKAKLLRVYLGEADRWHGQPLYDAIVKRLHMMDVSGATVYKGIMGYGMKGHTHKQGRFHLSHDLPVMIAVIDSEDKITQGAEAIEEMVEDGLIVISDVDYTRLVRRQPLGATTNANLPTG